MPLTEQEVDVRPLVDIESWGGSADFLKVVCPVDVPDGWWEVTWTPKGIEQVREILRAFHPDGEGAELAEAAFSCEPVVLIFQKNVLAGQVVYLEPPDDLELFAGVKVIVSGWGSELDLRSYLSGQAEARVLNGAPRVLPPMGMEEEPLVAIVEALRPLAAIDRRLRGLHADALDWRDRPRWWQFWKRETRSRPLSVENRRARRVR